MNKNNWEWGIFPTRGNWAGCWYACGCEDSSENAEKTARAVMCDDFREGVLDCPPEECKVMVKPEVCPLLVEVA